MSDSLFDSYLSNHAAAGAYTLVPAILGKDIQIVSAAKFILVVEKDSVFQVSTALGGRSQSILSWS